MLTVGAVICEPLYTTLRFVSWYLSQGADRIVLCFDNPDDPAIDVLAQAERVTCVRCTEAFWAKCGMSPERRFTKRQNKAMEYFYRRAEPGWFLHVDGDELLHLQGRTLAQTLEYMPTDVRGVLFMPAEEIRVAQPGGRSHFRLPMARPAVRKIYGKYARQMRRRQGLTGHRIGKAATRTGFTTARMRQHHMHFDDRSTLIDRWFGPPEGAFLLHFVGQTFDVWQSKLRWRLSARGFAGPMSNLLAEVMASENSAAELHALYRSLHFFDETRLAQLDEFNVHYAVDLGLDGIIAAYFPDHAKTSCAPVLSAA